MTVSALLCSPPGIFSATPICSKYRHLLSLPDLVGQFAGIGDQLGLAGVTQAWLQLSGRVRPARPKLDVHAGKERFFCGPGKDPRKYLQQHRQAENRCSRRAATGGLVQRREWHPSSTAILKPRLNCTFPSRKGGLAIDTEWATLPGRGRHVHSDLIWPNAMWRWPTRSGRTPAHYSGLAAIVLRHVGDKLGL